MWILVKPDGTPLSNQLWKSEQECQSSKENIIERLKKHRPRIRVEDGLVPLKKNPLNDLELVLSCKVEEIK